MPLHIEHIHQDDLTRYVEMYRDIGLYLERTRDHMECTEIYERENGEIIRVETVTSLAPLLYINISIRGTMHREIVSFTVGDRQ